MDGDHRSHRGAGPEAHRGGAGRVRGGPGRDAPGGHARGARDRLARPVRAGADPEPGVRHRGRSRRLRERLDPGRGAVDDDRVPEVSRGPAAITGVGAVTPLGDSAQALYERWRDGVCGLEDGVGACRDFDPTSMLSRKEARRTDRFVQFAIKASQEAIESAWGEDCPYDPERVACVLGVSMGGSEMMFEEYLKLKEKGEKWVSPLTVPVTMPNAPPAILAMRHGFRGETHSIASACASSAQAIGVGLRMIRLDEADAVIVGGTEACLTEYILTLFRNAGALSRSGNCRPFDKKRDGFVMGEGAGIMIIEQPAAAEKRGADVLGYLAGYGSSTDGHHLSAPDGSGRFPAHAVAGAPARA